MDHILVGLNEAQRVAVTSEASVLQVLAPPGSGKTKTLTARVAYLIAHREFQPWNIVVCTFTVKAAREMQERIRGFVGGELEKKLKIGTFHGIALRYLRQYRQHVGLDDKFGIADTSDTVAMLKRIIKTNNYAMDPSSVRGRISSQKAKGMDCEKFASTLVNKTSAEQTHFLKIFQEYQAALDKCHLLDYDDILLRCVALLKKHPECVYNIQAVLVDEFQDTNAIQYELMSLFAQRRNNITIVGDPDQSIYGWRSAEIKNLGRMKEQWSETLTVNLEENYRSSGAILHASQYIIEQDAHRPPKKLQATHALGQRPVLRTLPSAYDEASWLVSEIKRTQTLTGNMLTHSDFAILLRSAALSRSIENALSSAGIPYRMVGGTKFYDRMEVKLVLDYLRVIDQPSHDEALLRVLNVPARNIGDAAVKRLQAEAQNKNVTLWSLAKSIASGKGNANVSLSSQGKKGIELFVNVILSGQKKMKDDKSSLVELINMVSQKLALQNHLRKKHPDDYESRWANIEELVAQAADVSASAQSQKQLDSLQSGEDELLIEESPLSTLLSNAALTAAVDGRLGEQSEKISQVTISTIHAAKGLEWPVVFIPACYDGSIPHALSENEDEERRLLYVGMTRAQGILYLSQPLINTSKHPTELTAFLAEPGVVDFFETHGPSISFSHVQGLATTLKKDCPTQQCVREAVKELVWDEDNYYPLNGEEPFGYGSRHSNNFARDGGRSSGFTRSASWSTNPTSYQAPAPRAAGFSSVRSRYNELVQNQEQMQERKLDKTADNLAKQADHSKKRKVQTEGQPGIAKFFRQHSAPSNDTAHFKLPSAVQQGMLAAAPIHDAFNPALGPENNPYMSQMLKIPKYKVRTTPRYRPRSSFDDFETELPAQSNQAFVPRPPVPEPGNSAAANVNNVIPDASATQVRPAETLHSTSMQGLNGGRRTLGLKRSLNGWAPRQNY